MEAVKPTTTTKALRQDVYPHVTGYGRVALSKSLHLGRGRELPVAVAQ